MNQQKWTLIFGGIVLSLASAAAGVAISLSYVGKPLQNWQSQFSEAYLPMQADALKELKDGKPEKARAYLEMASTFSLISMGQQRMEGAAVPSNAEARQAVKDLCQPSVLTYESNPNAKITLAESCLLLLGAPEPSGP